MADTKNFLDLNGVGLLWAKVKLLLADKVDKETGKGLSSNDYTSDEKAKLANVASGAQVNVLEGIQKNGQTITPTNKIANITVPTTTSELTNDSGFITASDVTSVEFSIVDSFPTTGDSSIIYLVLASDGSGDDVYDEYIWLTANNKFEKIGRTNIDLSDYYNTANLMPITSAQIDAVCV